MKKIGIKFLENLEYEQFESFQYLFEYDFEYDDLVETIIEKRVIELDIDEDDSGDRIEDLEVLRELLENFDQKEINYELYIFDTGWKREELKNIS